MHWVREVSMKYSRITRMMDEAYDGMKRREKDVRLQEYLVLIDSGISGKISYLFH